MRIDQIEESHYNANMFPDTDKQLTASFNKEELHKLFGTSREVEKRGTIKILEKKFAESEQAHEALMSEDAEALLFEKAEELKGLALSLPNSVLSALPSNLVPNVNSLPTQQTTTPMSMADTPQEERKTKKKIENSNEV